MHWSNSITAGFVLVGSAILVLGGDSIPDESENSSACQTGPGYFDYGPHRIDAEAEQLAMIMAGQLRAPDDEYERILRDLQLIRDKYPVLTTVVDDPNFVPDQLIVRLQLPEPWVGYEELNAFYQANVVGVLSPSLQIYLIEFCDNLNALAIGPEYESVPEVLYADPNLMGQKNILTIQDLGGLYRYTIVDGFGGCFLGCDCNRIWDIDVKTNGTIVFQSYNEGGMPSCVFDDVACCQGAGLCSVTPIGTCMAQDGTPLELGAMCENEGATACLPTIPAVSTWGIMATVLLVLTAGTLIFARFELPSR